MHRMRRVLLSLLLTGYGLAAAQDSGQQDRVAVEAATLEVGRSMPVPVSLTNDQLIKCLNFGFVSAATSDSGFARFDSVVYVGRMQDGLMLNLRLGGKVNGDGISPDTTVVSAFLAGPEMSPLSVGTGEIFLLYFTGLRPGAFEISNAFLPPAGTFSMIPYEGTFRETLFEPAFTGRTIPILPARSYVCGNIDGSSDQVVDLADVTVCVDYLFISQAVPPGISAANVNGSADGQIDIADLLWLVSYLFLDGPAPSCP